MLLMVDEVQTGLGRTGRWFGFQHLGVEPDVVTMAKALGNGMPVGACWARPEVAAAFEPGDHGSTFGGQPLAMSAAQATLEVMEAEDVPARARSQAHACGTRSAALPGVVSVRGEGLLLAAVLDGEFAPTACRSALGGRAGGERAPRRRAALRSVAARDRRGDRRGGRHPRSVLAERVTA